MGNSGAGRILLGVGCEGDSQGSAPSESPKIPRGLRDAARAALARHLDPAPQLRLGAWLASRRRAATIDVSDGLLLDLERLARASMVRCELDARVLPLSPGFAPLCEFLGLEPFELALTGGEDYVLLFSLPAGVRPPVKFGATRVGRVIAAVERPEDTRVLVLGAALGKGQSHGWDHLSRLGDRPG